MPQGFAQLRIGPLDPVVHRVHRRDLGLVLHLVQHVALQVRRNVRQENILGVAIFLRQPRLELREAVQLRRQRHALIQVLRVAPRPEERFARSALQTFNVDGAALKYRGIFLAEIIAHNRNKVHRREKAGRHGEISCGTADRAFHFPVRTFQAIKRNRTNDE